MKRMCLALSTTSFQLLPCDLWFEWSLKTALKHVMRGLAREGAYFKVLQGMEVSTRVRCIYVELECEGCLRRPDNLRCGVMDDSIDRVSEYRYLYRC
ncbi:hypothetical protein BC830DRAFT_1143373 [Chytriomyces sp. MP71]|nr:hypothetical protein BC830DRAFT_1143373 [Chytriomyces sp. MP71]